MKKIITLILIIAWMLLVFLFSSQDSQKSSKLSGEVTKKVIEVIKNIDKTAITYPEKAETVIRKIAHYSIYTLGGILILLHVNLYNLSRKKKILISTLIGICYAITDEVHQLFISGRSGEIRDICIDLLGVITGIIILSLIMYLINKIRTLQKQEKST